MASASGRWAPPPPPPPPPVPPPPPPAGGRGCTGPRLTWQQGRPSGKQATLLTALRVCACGSPEGCWRSEGSQQEEEQSQDWGHLDARCWWPRLCSCSPSEGPQVSVCTIPWPRCSRSSPLTPSAVAGGAQGSPAPAPRPGVRPRQGPPRHHPGARPRRPRPRRPPRLPRARTHRPDTRPAPRARTCARVRPARPAPRAPRPGVRAPRPPPRARRPPRPSSARPRPHSPAPCAPGPGPGHGKRPPRPPRAAVLDPGRCPPPTVAEVPSPARGARRGAPSRPPGGARGAGRGCGRPPRRLLGLCAAGRPAPRLSSAPDLEVKAAGPSASAALPPSGRDPPLRPPETSVHPLSWALAAALAFPPSAMATRLCSVCVPESCHLSLLHWPSTGLAGLGSSSPGGGGEGEGVTVSEWDPPFHSWVGILSPKVMVLRCGLREVVVRVQ
ncbi:unnamed protein product [Nyctereutes procyonoides]|uniref:(raccoon dog) hypothetical protein n=1 Tax=Nyctereutes procyonoides TaxID=34880 RepID=A0A811ZH01_NYCPR|nr:unnamed protein product [Nyctereutes procyonoides]